MSDGAPDPRVGTRVAQRYRILAPLGAGGIGTVYLAEDELLGMHVALKLLRPELAADAEVVARFDREAKAMAALAHEHIVQPLSFGRTPEGEICLVMEYVAGETLRSALGRLNPFPPAAALMIATQLGAALARAHALGVVHRDLKPENVMVCWLGAQNLRLKVLDFGMARVLGGTFGSGNAPLTRKGAVFGTPEYMPPEQAMGQPVDARADQYALGVMLFEMLAGQRPFRAATPLDVLQLQIHQPPPGLSEIAPGVPPAVAAVIARMLAKRAEQRFADVPSAVAALLAAAHPPATPTPAEGLPERRWWQRFGRS